MSYVVQIVQTENNEGGELNGAFIDCLRYAGLIKVHEIDPNGVTINVFDILPPHGSKTRMWAEMNAERMRSFGFIAEPQKRV